MSLDVYLHGPKYETKCECSQCGNEHVRKTRDTYYDANITHNLNRMAESAGIYEHLWRPEEIGVTKASQLIEPLAAGLEMLRSNRKRFEVFNPSNGWGNYDGLVRFVSNYLDACREHPEADVYASR